MNVVSVQFQRAGKLYDFSYSNLSLSVGDQVLVDSERGASPAEVMAVKFVPPGKGERKFKPVLRKLSSKEVDKTPKLSDEEVLRITAGQIKDLGLDMRLLKAEQQFGGSKIVVYFSAGGRVDFRRLVKDLAAQLKTRIELKQVGARDETKLVGGMGICGREYCCSSFLREFIPVSIRMAKNQNLALNPTKVSGGCGRLLCCLTYENDVYTELRQKLPKKGTKVKILSNGLVGYVEKADLLNQTLSLSTEQDGDQHVKLSEVEILQASVKGPGGGGLGGPRKGEQREKARARGPRSVALAAQAKKEDSGD